MNILGIYRGYREKKKIKIDRQLPCMNLMVLAHTFLLDFTNKILITDKFRKGNNHIFMLKIVQHEVVD